MAGSRQDGTPNPFRPDDPVLTAHLESVRAFGERLSEPIAVIDRQFNLVYANRPAHESPDCREVEAPAVKCHTAFVGQSDPCSTCPAQQVFNGLDFKQVIERLSPNAVTCGVVETFPLHSADGKLACVVQILKPRVGAGRFPTEAGERRSQESDHLGRLIGHSPAMRDLFEMIRLIADSQATALLQGESGTGKELVARTIHQLSGRRNQPFVVVDCGTLTETLLESELFGHLKGSFTGAHMSKKGLFQEADGGTIFLDEIADTSAHFQAKLLRVLQEGEVKPVGSGRSIKVNVRVVSATNKDLQGLIKTKAFREDLYYRLAVLPLALPPLRERREDIPLLVRHFVEASSKRHHKPARDVTTEALRALTDAPWPGNIRELEHLIERAVVTTSGPQLTRSHFFGSDSAHIASAETDLRSVARNATQQAERTRIEEALRQASGNRSRAARLLKVSRANLYNKLRAYQID
ncbi:MAG: sigma-54-dependent Fis family transcriptional regulator [Nitrospirota bacterium]|nr:sigma-54-dependent Fis family transcriptional regulator [Nitrospirota bacterium]MDE3243089.1 sigma-54-dependent Fis family transcriptional regulator [Nitrospirota bacterium]